MFFERDHERNIRAGGAVSATALIMLHVIAYALVLAVFPAFTLWAAILSVTLIGISCHDTRTFEIPDRLSALLALTGAVSLLWLSPGMRLDHVLAAIGLSVILYLVGVLYMRMRGQPGLGFGDVKLAFGLGLWLGVVGSIWTLLAASLSGLVLLLLFATLRRTPASEITASGVAFGPFLCLSAWAIWLQGHTI